MRGFKSIYDGGASADKHGGMAAIAYACCRRERGVQIVSTLPNLTAHCMFKQGGEGGTALKENRCMGNSWRTFQLDREEGGTL